jgi:tripartite-type tricarboxylate transporter receptor subunit TctC
MPHLKSGQVRAIAVTSAERSTRMPDIPTVSESGVPNFEASSWNGILVATGTPPAIVKRLESEIAKILKTPELQQWYVENSATTGAQSSEKFSEMIQQSMQKWALLAKSIGIKPD